MKIIKNWKVLWAIIAVLFLIVAILTSSLFKTRMSAIDDFESCAAKYPVLESYPAQCITPDGRHFTQVISDDEAVACTMEVKECSDGSYVGRTGPNCEFSPCP